MSRAPRVAVVGGGILGTVTALRLAQRGASVTLLERAPSLGGLAASMDFDGHTVDRFYHVITPADSRMIALAEELGIGDQLHFREVGAGFFIDGELHDFNGIGDFLRFSPLTPLQRLRLGWFVAQCQLRSGYDRLDGIPLERWLRRHCGKGVVERIWRPLLDSRFDSRHGELPATYLWARTRRMSGARTGRDQGEQRGHIAGGHQRLIDAIADRAVELGVNVRVGAPVSGLDIDESGAVRGVTLEDEVVPADLTIVTLQPPALRFLLPAHMQTLVDAYPQRYLGVVCLVLKMKRELLPYYAVNICEPTPITTVVESSHVVGTDHLGGLRLVYVPKYCDPEAPEQSESDDSIYQRFTAQIARMAPSFSHDDVAAWTVQRAKLVEPVHPLGAGAAMAPVFPGVDGLALASNAQIYPRLLNGDSVTLFAEEVAAQTGDRLRLAPPAHEERPPAAPVRSREAADVRG